MDYFRDIVCDGWRGDECGIVNYFGIAKLLEAIDVGIGGNVHAPVAGRVYPTYFAVNVNLEKGWRLNGLLK